MHGVKKVLTDVTTSTLPLAPRAEPFFYTPSMAAAPRRVITYKRRERLPASREEIMLKTIGRAMIALAWERARPPRLAAATSPSPWSNPDNNQPVMNQQNPREPERGEKPRRPDG